LHRVLLFGIRIQEPLVYTTFEARCRCLILRGGHELIVARIRIIRPTFVCKQSVVFQT